MEQKKHIYKKKRILNCKLSKLLTFKLIKKGKINQAKKIWIKNLLELKFLYQLPIAIRKNLILNLLHKLGPQIDQRKLRLGQNVIEVPFPITKTRKIFVCFQWFLNLAKQRQKENHNSLGKNLAHCFFEILKEKSPLLKKKKLWQNLAYKNIRFIRYRWL